MPRIETSLSAGYSPEWGVKEAIREIVSNAIDGAAREMQSWEAKYFPRTMRLEIRNKGVKVPTSALLMGKSASRNYDECIGTFGEGLPMALLVLSRMGYEVQIFNDDEKWTPSIDYSEAYEERVLVVKTRSIKSREAFIVQVEGISATQWEEYKRMFLELHPSFERNKAGHNAATGEGVLFQEEMRGCIFNKGVLVTQRDDLALGYNFSIGLNRDRDFLDGYNVQQYAGRILASIFACAMSEQQDKYLELLMGAEKSFELGTAYGPLTDCAGFKQAVKRWWDRKKSNDANVMPVSNRRNQQALEKNGFTTVRVPEAIGEALGVDDDDYEKSVELRRREPTVVWSVSDMEEQEMDVLRRAMKATVPIRPKAMAGEIKVVDFRDAAVTGHYRKHNSKHQYLLSREVLVTEESTVAALISAITTADLTSQGCDEIQRSSFTANQVQALIRTMINNASGGN